MTTLLTPESETMINNHLLAHIPNAMGIYAFGSQTQGTANQQSDLDLAVLLSGYAEPLQLWTIANQLANLLNIEIDLLDLRAATTVMQYQVITQGKRLWRKDLSTDLFETHVLSEKTNLEEARANLLDDIKKSGTVYGR
jgi:predicted nucleotidyltransferase